MHRHRAAPPPPSPEQAAARDRWSGRWNVPIFAAAIVPLLTTPAPGQTTQFSGGTAAAVVATRPLRRFTARLGKVAIVAGLVVLFGSLFAYGAEHKANPGFATIGDALWWGIVTLTTVGYGDIVPRTGAGRAAGIVTMFTGVAVVGILAGSLAELFGLARAEPAQEPPSAPQERPATVHDELVALRAELEGRVGEPADRALEART